MSTCFELLSHDPDVTSCCLTQVQHFLLLVFHTQNEVKQIMFKGHPKQNSVVIFKVLWIVFYRPKTQVFQNIN